MQTRHSKAGGALKVLRAQRRRPRRQPRAPALLRGHGLLAGSPRRRALPPKRRLRPEVVTMHPEGVQRMADRMEAADTGWQGGLQHAMTAMQEALDLVPGHVQGAHCCAWHAARRGAPPGRGGRPCWPASLRFAHGCAPPGQRGAFPAHAPDIDDFSKARAWSQAGEVPDLARTENVFKDIDIERLIRQMAWTKNK